MSEQPVEKPVDPIALFDQYMTVRDAEVKDAYGGDPPFPLFVVDLAALALCLFADGVVRASTPSNNSGDSSA